MQNVRLEYVPLTIEHQLCDILNSLILDWNAIWLTIWCGIGGEMEVPKNSSHMHLLSTKNSQYNSHFSRFNAMAHWPINGL